MTGQEQIEKLFADFQALHPNNREKFDPTIDNLIRWEYAVRIARERAAIATEPFDRPNDTRSRRYANSRRVATFKQFPALTQNKYMATPRGVFELKYFFTNALPSASGAEGVSTLAVRERIKALVDQEKQTQILSDDQIAALLRGEGIDIARRTVAKYRESLGIPSSAQRRRDKRVG